MMVPETTKATGMKMVEMPQVKAALWNDRVESLVLELAADLEVSVEARPDQARRAADAFVASMMESLVAEYEEEFAAELAPRRGRCA